MILEFFKHLRKERADAVAKRAELRKFFEEFLVETTPLVPQGSRHPKAALYRHAWKRAAILGIIYQQKSDQLLALRYEEFEKMAGQRYFEVAPDGLYGKAPLVMGERTGARLLEFERKRLFPQTERNSRIRPLACIYVGICDHGHVYVGQTVGPPESRWVQHRFGSTGPFKNGESYVEWKVIEGNIDPGRLNERESYYIGLYDTKENGYNGTSGNDYKAYERGQAERIRINGLSVPQKS